MKLFTCLAHADPKKNSILAKVLASQEKLFEKVHVCVITNLTAQADIEAIYQCAPNNTNNFKLEVFNEGCNLLPSPWLLTWVHKKLMLQKYNDTSYTHFMCIEDDMEITSTNVEYWIRCREYLRAYNLYPSFMRVEWNYEHQQWAMTDSMKGDSFSISKSPRIDLRDGFSFINLSRAYQGMFLYDRELMKEHIDSISFNLFEFIPDWQERIKHLEWPMGLTENAVFALTYMNVPRGFYSRNCIPVFTKYKMIDPACFVHHLPNKYTNMSNMNHGKVLVNDLLIE